MPAERAGYTVTMFLVDISPSMGKTRTVELPPGPDGEARSTDMTHLEWALQFVKMKIQDMIFGGRKTEQCGIILFGSEDTKNVVNAKIGAYDNVYEYVEIGQPNSGTIAKLDALHASTIAGDPIDALVVGIETQAEYLLKKKTWTRKVILVTDGESPIELEQWEDVVKKMNSYDISLTIVGVDFDDPEYPYEGPEKSVIKTTNEQFYHNLTKSLSNGMIGTCAHALQEITRPDIHIVKSALMGTVLRLGDVEVHPDDAIEISVKMSKCTAISRPKSWKKFAPRNKSSKMEIDGDEAKAEFAQLKMRSEYYVNRAEGQEEDADTEDLKDDQLGDLTADGEQQPKSEQLEKVEKEDLIRGFKYGATYVPCPDGQFPKLPTKKGIDICGFFPMKNFKREYSMGEIQYVWADPSSSQQQGALSSIVQAMYQKDSVAIARLVTRDGMDPKMGVLVPTMFDKVDCFLWAQMPFADDVRRYSFASLERLISKKGEVIDTHPYLPSREQQTAMDTLVDAMDLMRAGDKDEEGNRQPWFDTRLSYNPSLHRVRQALYHGAIILDLKRQPLPPPHPELLKYFSTPRRVIKKAEDAVGECKHIFKVREVPKKVGTKTRRNDHAHAEEEDDGNFLLLDRAPVLGETLSFSIHSQTKGKSKATESDGSITEEDDDDDFVHAKKELTPNGRGQKAASLPTPARSMSPLKGETHEEGMNVDEASLDEIDPGRIPGRIIGTTDPLRDFRMNLERGDVVTKAVEDMGFVVSEIAMRPFAWRRTGELMECLKEMRNMALKEDEIDAWNAFLKGFKKKCLAKGGNQDFWQEVKKVGRTLSLISKSEADGHGGISMVKEKEAEEFLS